MIEIWKDIRNYEGSYQISNLGRCRTITRKLMRSDGYEITYNQRYLKPMKDKVGYIRYGLTKNGKRKYNYAHRLVAKAFIPNHNNYPEINHMDENKSNNHVDNLEWCTRKYNINYGNATLKATQSRSKPVNKYSLDGEFIETYPSATHVSKKYNHGTNGIYRCCNGFANKAYGYLWRYADD